MNGSGPKYSLVVATLGRRDELALLLDSLLAQTLGTDQFEVIIVDQNEPGFLEPTLLPYYGRLQLRHLSSDFKGLSRNRNKGMAQALGDYILVPDDDCTYYPDTLQRITEGLDTHGAPDLLIGEVFDRERNCHVFKTTPAQVMPVGEANFYRFVSSITLCFRKDAGRFDEAFGVGAPYASNEDGVFLLSCIRDGRRVLYVPGIQFNHPPYSAATMSLQKLYQYGIGFGAMCRKFWSLLIAWLLLKVLVFQVLMGALALLRWRRVEARRRWYALKGRCSGFFNYVAAGRPQ